MDRRRFLLTSIVSGLAPLAAHAQTTSKLWRIGWLADGGPTDPRIYRVTFVQGLETLGWIDGRNIVLEVRYAERLLERHPALAVDLVKAKPDVIVAGSNAAIEAAKNATSTIPIVMVASLAPVARGFVKSLSRPGGNVTGLSWDADPRMSEKYIEILREVLPRLSLVGTLFDPFPGIEPYIAAYEAAATRVGVRHPRFVVRRKEDFDRAFADMGQQHVQAVRINGSALTLLNGRRIAELALKYRLPSISPFSDFPDAGGLMSYGTDLADLYRRAAIYVDKILRGANPTELPIEQPTKFKLVINLKTARALGLTIPPSLLARADQVIE